MNDIKSLPLFVIMKTLMGIKINQICFIFLAYISNDLKKTNFIEKKNLRKLGKKHIENIWPFLEVGGRSGVCT